MIVLAIDTALDACSAAAVQDEVVLAAASEPMQRGHQERLAPMVAEVMTAAGVAFGRLDRIGVTTGPGSFTGLRVGLAFAKGLALALEIDCVGIGSLEALAADAPAPGHVAAVVDARRGQVYLQLFEGGAALGPPEALTLDEAAARLARIARPLTLVGSGAPLLADRTPGATVAHSAAPDPVRLARLAARAAGGPGSPAPIYLRAPDARLPA